MNNKLQIFANEQFGSVRIIEEDGKVLFCGNDIANALGYSNPRKALIDHCKGVTKRDTLTAGGTQSISFIPEGDVYRLIVSSKLPKAQEFERWVFDNVLPTIRKHGAYMTQDTLEKALTSPDFLIQLATQLKEEQEARKALEAEKAVLLPKASYYDVILNCPDLISVTQIAKDYGMSAIELNTILSQEKVQFKQGGEWILYQKYAEKGYAGSRTGAHLGKSGEVKSHSHTYWTQKGREFIYKLLKEKRGIVPIMERETEETA